MAQKLNAQQIIDAIRALYGDTAVPRSTTKENLQEIQEEVELLLETLAGE